MQVLSIKTAISAPSIRYSRQCVQIASAREAERGSAVTGNRRVVGMMQREYLLPNRGFLPIRRSWSVFRRIPRLNGETSTAKLHPMEPGTSETNRNVEEGQPPA